MFAAKIIHEHVGLGLPVEVAGDVGVDQDHGRVSGLVETQSLLEAGGADASLEHQQDVGALRGVEDQEVSELGEQPADAGEHSHDDEQPAKAAAPARRFSRSGGCRRGFRVELALKHAVINGLPPLKGLAIFFSLYPALRLRLRAGLDYFAPAALNWAFPLPEV